jgi:hypothetical protein
MNDILKSNHQITVLAEKPALRCGEAALRTKELLDAGQCNDA